jgi:hypothetical protein
LGIPVSILRFSQFPRLKSPSFVALGNWLRLHHQAAI